MRVGQVCTRSWLDKLLVLACACGLAGLVASCGDDDGNEARDTTTDASSDQSADVAVDQTSDQAIDQTLDQTIEDTAGDTEEDVPVSACSSPQDPDPVTAVYDAFVTESFAGEATVTKTGADVVVTVDTETFTGQFRPGTNCIPERYEDGLLFPLCFVSADGLPAAPESLGAMLITGPNATIGVVAAQRRGVDRSCAFSGHYLLTAADLTVTPDTTDSALVDPLLAELGGYLQIYQLQTQTVAVIGATAPRVINPFAINATGDGFDDAERNVLLDLGGGNDWAVVYQATSGTFGTDSVSFDLTLTVEGVGTANGGQSFTVTGSMTGARQ